MGRSPLGRANSVQEATICSGTQNRRIDRSGGVTWKWDGGNADVGWKNFLRWHESKTQFVIYTSPIMFNMIPKRALTSEQIFELRDLLANHVGVTPSAHQVQ